MSRRFLRIDGAILFILVWTCVASSAVTTEDILRVSIGLEKKITNHVTAEFEAQSRYGNRYRDYDKSFAEFSLQLRHWKYLHFSPGFRYGSDEIGTFYRGSVAAIYGVPTKYIKPSIRLKYQYDDGENRASEKTIRSKITFGTSSKIPGSPYVYGEIFHTVSNRELIQDKYRIGTGFKVRFTSHQSLKLYGIYEKEIAGDGDIARIIGLKYEYEF